MPKGVYKRTKECNEAHMKQFFCNIAGCNKKHYCKGLCNKHYDAQHHKDNKKSKAKYGKQYRQTLTGKASQKAHRARYRALTKDLTKEVVQRVYEDNIKKYGVLTCYLCLKPIIANDDSLDHSTPLTREGTNNYDNLGIAHMSCNNQKKTMTLEEWFKSRKDMGWINEPLHLG